MPPSRSKATESTPTTCFFSMKHIISLTNVVSTISIFAYHRGYNAHSCFVLIHSSIWCRVFWRYEIWKMVLIGAACLSSNLFLKPESNHRIDQWEGCKEHWRHVQCINPTLRIRRRSNEYSIYRKQPTVNSHTTNSPNILEEMMIQPCSELQR